ncbi:MAG TPA: hypothetical protein VFQ61_14635, partial [Polyangiaceae bacterium]|nr:hypothetical protein [Polyangiaceae bacterium]
PRVARLEQLDRYGEGTLLFRPGLPAEFARKVVAEPESSSATLELSLAFGLDSPLPQATWTVASRRAALSSLASLPGLSPFLPPARRERLQSMFDALSCEPRLRGESGLATRIGLSRDSSGFELLAEIAAEPLASAESSLAAASTWIAEQSRATASRPLQSAVCDAESGKFSLRTEAQPRPDQDSRSRAPTLDQVERDFEAQPLFARLGSGGTFSQLQRVAPQLAFFVLSLPDLLNQGRPADLHSSVDPMLGSELSAFLDGLERELRQLSRAFLRDLERLSVPCELGFVYSEEHEPVRRLVYELSAELRGASAHARAGMLAALGLASSLFQRGIARLVQRLGLSDELEYFDPTRAYGSDLCRRFLTRAPASERMQSCLRIFRELPRLCHHLEGRLCASEFQALGSLKRASLRIREL